MTEFFVDARGLTGLHHQVIRAGQDAEQVAGYARKHGDLTMTAEGYLMIMLGPHAIAYASMIKAVQRLADLAQEAAAQVDAARRDYARTDQVVAARLDAGYAGAEDPGLLYGIIATGRRDLWPAPSRAAFADVAEPLAELHPPGYATDVAMWSINPLADLISPSAWLRQVSVWVFGHDPFGGWAKQFSGDWNAYVRCAVAWATIGAACEAIGRNLTAGAADVAVVWRGNAAEGEQEYQLALGAAATGLGGACIRYHELYLRAAGATKDLYEVVSGLMSRLIDILIVVNAAGAVGTATIETGVGPVLGYSVALFYVWQACKLYEEISGFFGTADTLITALAGSVDAVRAKLAVDELPRTRPYRHPAGY
ncbi:hypothetical protein HH310_17115 [Actinoplanes sp. TBRC 11911]|uniref:hypothetical protein n=1 Tax=Actinoplanes sp. TBRC 11911 TaxID=2729386 RepID=UPI00145EE801|nr:hypothetical protein [Actinoplanes sp. TBRC 11911]NMO52905.1 hypothetical protein [Actinoplanes sp. TBRC 11911]